MDRYLLWWDGLKKIGKKNKLRLLEAFGTAEEIYRAEPSGIAAVIGEEKASCLMEQKDEKAVESAYEALQKNRIQMVCMKEATFPGRLLKIPDCPPVLYVRGKLPEENVLSVAVVGARECSDYGRYVARELGKALGEAGIQVISGMARGIDGISQQAALEAGGWSCGILGCGVDICYPRENRELYERLCETGGVVSSYPPGTQPLPQLFPPRNRIVSGLADALVVIEARQKSGTLITVDMALEQGRDVYAVPGRVTDRLSDGCNQLIRDGAHVFLSPKDFLEQIKRANPERCRTLQKVGNAGKDAGETKRPEGELENLLYDLLDLYPQSMEELKGKLRERLGEKKYVEIQPKIVTVLMKLCVCDFASQLSPGWFQKNSHV